MGLKVTITIDGATRIENGVWKARIQPEEVITLGQCDSRSGPFSVVLLESNVAYNPTARTLTFDPDNVRLLNVGSTEQIFLFSNNAEAPVEQAPVMPADKPKIEAQPEPVLRKKPTFEKAPEYELSQALATGDKLFLSELPVEMRELGESLLSEVRRHFAGELAYEPRSAKFDETPEIFWTVKIHPQDGSLRLTVRGTPDMFEPIAGIDLKLDKFGYSAFAINRIGQLSGAINLIMQAHRNLQG
jgi:hypothetical protein